VEKDRMGLKLQDAMKHFQFLKTKLKAAAQTQCTQNIAQSQDRNKTATFNGQHSYDGNSKTTTVIPKIQDKQIQFLKTELMVAVPRQDTSNIAQSQDRNKTATFNGHDRKDSYDGNSKTTTVIPKIQDKQIQFLKTELMVAVPRQDTSNSRKARIETKLPLSMDKIEGVVMKVCAHTLTKVWKLFTNSKC
jgi:prolyl oligopeptidase PreP (S9A serine peptidase family)